MANKIRISTLELEAQAAKLNELSNNLKDINVKANKALSLIDDALDSIFFTTTMVPKSLKLRGNIALLIDYLNTGSKVAHKCATSFKNADVVLRRTIEESLTSEVYNTPVSMQEVKSEFECRVDDMKEKKGFRQGDYNHNDFMNSYIKNYNDRPVGGSQCYAMALMMQIEVLGVQGSVYKPTSFNDIKVGDVVHYFGGGADAKHGHWVFVTDVQPGKIIVSEGNWAPPGAANHGREITENSINVSEIRRV